MHEILNESQTNLQDACKLITDVCMYVCMDVCMYFHVFCKNDDSENIKA